MAHADVAQLVEHHLAKVRVAGSNPVVRSQSQAQLVEQASFYELCVQARPAFDQHGPQAEVLKLGERTAEIEPLEGDRSAPTVSRRP